MLPLEEKDIIVLLIIGIAVTIIGTIFGLAVLGILNIFYINDIDMLLRFYFKIII